MYPRHHHPKQKQQEQQRRQLSRVVLVALLFVVVAAAAVPGKVGAAEDVATAQIKWPRWFWCFPDCVIGKTCFYRVFDYCDQQEPTAGDLLCTIVALDWCDIGHVFQSSGRYPPPPGFRQRKALASASASAASEHY